MESKFSVEEKRAWMFRKHLRDHAFEYALDIILTVLCAVLLLTVCRAENLLLGILISFVWAVARVLRQIYHYKKEYVNLQIK